MAKRWQLITVELVHGRGVDYDPPPGREILCPLETTFEQLALTIDKAFGRWDLAHLRQFVLPDRTVVTDPETIAEVFADGETMTLPLAEVVRPRLERLQRFEYVFDLGDGWTHRCTVRDFVDPDETYGSRPTEPVAVFGWGSIPDQYGRRTADDTGDAVDEQRAGPSQGAARPGAAPVDGSAIRAIVGTGTVAGLIEAITDADVDSALQHVGCALLRMIPPGSALPPDAGPAIERVIDRLSIRSAEGDAELVEQLRGLVDGQPPDGTIVRVDLDELVTSVSDSDLGSRGCYLHSESGETVPAGIVDQGLADDWDLDMEDPAWRYVEFETGTWQDMADFVDGLDDPQAQQRLSRAIEGKGAFRRFRDTIGELDLVDRWLTFRDDRDLGRARAALADIDLRPI